MEIYLIRHTTPDVPKGVCYGQSDIDCTGSFYEEGNAVMEILPSQLDAVYTSPLKRCSKLAHLISERKQINLISDIRLLELHFGDWEMKLWNDIDEEILNKWMADFVNIKAQGGENYNDLHIRTNSFLADLVGKQFKKIAIVTHGGVIRSMLASVVGLPLANSFKLQVDYSSVTKIELNENDCYNKIVFHNKR